MTDSYREILLASRPDGVPEPEHFTLRTGPIPKPGPGQVLLRTKLLSLDPYMRGRMSDARSYATPVDIGGVMEGEAVAEVIASDAAGFRPGDMVLARTGWRSHAAMDAADLRPIPDNGLPESTALGVLGMPGFTAYLGVHVFGRLQPGETLALGAASGAVGAIVGQLAKRQGARVVGVAGGAEKCAYLTDELGFDAAIDRRAPGMAEALAAACPQGIDVYFENVGGALWQAVLPLLNTRARVPLCGLMAASGGDPQAAGSHDLLPATMRVLLTRSVMLHGFINYHYEAEHFAAFQRIVTPLVADGSLKYREDIVEGLEAAPAAFIGMLRGRNFGKLLVRVA